MVIKFTIPDLPDAVLVKPRVFPIIPPFGWKVAATKKRKGVQKIILTSSKAMERFQKKLDKLKS
jgi:hypothetical protein